MVEILGIKSRATQFQSGSNDRCIPMGNLKPAPDLHGGDDQSETDRQNDSCRCEFQRSFDVRLADSQFFLPQRVGDVLLQDLGRQSKGSLGDQVLGPFSFHFVLCRIGTRVEKDIGIQENFSAHRFPLA